MQTRLLRRLRHIGWMLAAAAVLFVAGTQGAKSSFLSNYYYQFGTGAGTDMTVDTTLTMDGSGSLNIDDGYSQIKDIGFTFKLDGTSYTQFRAGVNGMMGLGNSGTVNINSTFSNNLSSTTSNPVIAAWWDDQHMTLNASSAATSKISYRVTGTAPNRVLTVQWRVGAYPSGTSVVPYEYQVRLYEGTDMIDFVYINMPTTASRSASIGATTNGSINNIYWVPPTAQGAGLSLFSGTDPRNINLLTGANPQHLLPANTIYRFVPCDPNIAIAGNIAQGGTATMANNDSLLNGYQVQRGSVGTRQPFSITSGLGAYPACANRTYTYTISGANAADYSITPTTGIISTGQTLTPTINFTPSALGIRTATLMVTDNNGFSRSYTLVGQGTTRVGYTGDLAEGGTVNMASGDTLMKGIKVDRLFFEDFMPFTVANTNGNTNSGFMTTVTISDPTGQYRLVHPNTSQLVTSYSRTLNGTQSYTPVIRFSPLGVGYQPATLTVTTEDGTRTYTLYAFSRAAGADFFVGNDKIGPNTEFFKKDYLCAGETAITIPITVKNVGEGTFRIFGVTGAYEMDTLYGQGVPKYPLERDQFGDPIATMDYFITTDPGVAPRPLNFFPQYPLETPEAGTSTFYLTFVPQLPGKRFTRFFINTNAANFTGMDPYGVTRDGLLVLELFGRGLGSRPTDIVDGTTLPKPVTMPSVMIGSSSEKTVTIYNTGACDLRIDRKKFQITSGDKNEFKILEAFANATVDQTNDTWILAPGTSSEVKFMFKPSRTGTRRVTVWMQTNDSTIIVPGLTERGGYYWDVTGVGSAGLETRDAMFPPSVIGGAVADQSMASAMVENTTHELLYINKMEITGTDASEFTMNTAKPWPAVPFAVMPGAAMHFSVVHTPAPASQPGPRTAVLELTLNSGDVIRLNLIGEAGTRTLAVTPASLFDNVTIPVGKIARQTVMITNNGTIPLKLGTTTISGPTSTDYTLGRVPRTTLAPGQTEYLEVTYRPLNKGTSSATMTIASNATNGAQTVTLGGTATKLGPVTGENAGTSGVEDAEFSYGMKLWQNVPNPGRDRVEIAYELREAGEAVLALYDANGKQINLLRSGISEAGTHRVAVDVSGLASGVYHYRLMVNGQTLTRAMTIQK
ncbi:MAG: choice-of-anchor D domain-containing protein [Armatimonadetes bacterium]|nr:choice-of-anchor D domain-containing protein [Armatimonadota bacterium]